MSNTQSTDIAVKPATVDKVKTIKLVELLSARDKAQSADATVRLSAPGQAPVDMLAEKHANNISKALAKSAGRLAYRMACIHAGFGDPEA